MSESTTQDVRARVVRAILAGAVLVEALVCLGYGVFLAVETVVAPAADRTAAVVMAATALVLGAGLLVGVRAAWRGRRAARSPIVVWQLLQLSIAYLTIGTGWLAFGIVLAVLAFGVLISAFMSPWA